MMEVDPKLLTTEGWQVCVDSKEACFVESGEIIKSGIGKEKVEEVAHVVNEEKLEEKWFGNVLFKCVGVAIMDLVTGEEVVRIAREKREGLELEGFQ